ncbi:MAG: hypothetical protein NVSMB29_19650 [Candidatus Dormibacteria bacterium]
MNASTSPADTHATPARPSRPPHTGDEQIGLNGRLAAWMTRRLGSMWVVYLTVMFVLTWMTLATWGPLHKADPYPFPFLLFMGNVVQLLLVFVILVGQGVLGKVADRRALQTYNDAEAILGEVTLLHTHMQAQDRILNQGAELVESEPHAWVKQRKLVEPPRVAAQFVGINGRIGAWITARVSTMWAFYVATLFQFGWIGLAQAGIIRFDPYPFAFLLFISSLLQLIFMFVIMVGQDVLGRAGDQRAQQTFLDAEAVLHECNRLQQHLTVQDGVIVKLCDYIKANAPATHPIRQALPPHRLTLRAPG